MIYEIVSSQLGRRTEAPADGRVRTGLARKRKRATRRTSMR